ncbi:MAG: hypothetical protein U0939_04700 [Pirellulales bacterium]
MFRFLNSFILALALTAVSVGCGSAGKPAPSGLVAASGVVTLDDKPLVGAQVMLIPVKATDGNTGAGGVTDSTGKFTLTSNEGGAAGAVPGTYRVVVSCLTKSDGTPVIPGPDESPMQLMIAGAKEQVPAKYSDAVASKLMATVDSTGAPIELKLTSK